MKYRELGSIGLKVSEVSFGTWAIGGAWGNVDEKEALDGLARAIDRGVNFLTPPTSMATAAPNICSPSRPRGARTRFTSRRNSVGRAIFTTRTHTLKRRFVRTVKQV